MRSRKLNAFFLLLFSMSAFILPMFPVGPADVYAANAGDTLSNIQEKIKQKIQKITETKKKETSIQTKIKDIDKNISKKEKELRRFDTSISYTQTEIDKLADDVISLNERLDSRKLYLKERIIAIYKRQYGGKAFVLISAKDYQDLIRKSNYLNLMAYYDKNIIDEYSTSIKEINLKRSDLETVKKNLMEDRTQAQRRKGELKANRSAKDDLLAKVQASRIDYEKKIKSLENTSKQFQSVIKQLRSKTIPKAILGPGFSTLKGAIPWPVEGSVIIPYGKYTDPEFKVTSFKSGVEIKTGTDNSVKAIAGGRVVYISNVKGYGKTLIIDHGSGYFSLYGNLKDLVIEQGNLLIKGMDIGKTDVSQLTNVPALYFEIRHNGMSVDPLTWLQRKG